MSGSPIRILLVDDVQLFREIEKTFLHRSGYEILTAATGLEALEKAREYQPKLILLDCLMPVMDGIECCRRIKSDQAAAVGGRARRVAVAGPHARPALLQGNIGFRVR